MKVNALSCWIGIAVGFNSAFSFAGPNEDTLRNLYDSANVPADASDFSEVNLYSSSSFVSGKNICVQIGKNDIASSFIIARVYRVIPDSGPLIPGKREEKLLFRSGTGVFGDFDLAAQAQVVNRDLVIVHPSYFLRSDPRTGKSFPVMARVLSRKSGEFIAFKVQLDYGSPDMPNEESYGYCYPNDTTH